MSGRGECFKGDKYFEGGHIKGFKGVKEKNKGGKGERRNRGDRKGEVLNGSRSLCEIPSFP